MISRREWMAASAGVAIGGAVQSALGQDKAKTLEFCAFIKFLQELSYPDLARKISELGFDGIEATVRDGGHVLPERVEEDLPRLVEALKKENLNLTIMASSVNSAKHPLTEKVLRTAARLGVKRYRLAYLRYDLSRPIPLQLKEHSDQLRELAAMNKDLGIAGIYQNHAGATTVGSAIWDIHEILKDISPEEISVAYDIRHATVEGGHNWPLNLELIKPQIGALYVKDFTWKAGTRDAVNVPLGEGRVNPRFFDIARSFFQGPVSLHVEYLPAAGIQANLQAIKADFETLRELMPVS
jgi:sugar phosphate isomerase/epimerase